jgi:hypothetical protein
MMFMIPNVPDKPLRDFLTDDSHSRQIEQQERYQGRVFNGKGHISEQTIKNDQRDIQEIEGSLGLQRQLLLILAERNYLMTGKPESKSIS